MPAALLALLLAGCATAPGSSYMRGQDVLHSWTQFGPGGVLSLRAVVPAGTNCPSADVDGVAQRMTLRAAASTSATVFAANPAFNPPFAVASCELGLPADTGQVHLAGRRVALGQHPGQTRRIVVVGDTGCRIKVPASGAGDPVQDCSDPQAWPWARIAAAAARTNPDLIIHLGDYHYREYCDDPLRCDRFRQSGTIIGYGWAGWQADFFAPAGSLLGQAPWVFVRGNHENCDRSGEGWMRFLAPAAYVACTDQRYRTPSRSLLSSNFTADAYRINIDSELGLVVADNAGHEDYRPASALPAELDLFRQTLAALRAAPAGQRQWLLAHRPLWYDLLPPELPENAFQAALHQPPSTLQLVLSGHQHAFGTLAFRADADPERYPEGRPAQLIVGASGTQLESLDPKSPLYEGKDGAGSRERSAPDGRLYEGLAAASGIVLNRYGFLLLERDEGDWSGTVLDADGVVLTRCRLKGEAKQFDCRFPGR